ncbi:MAG: phosphatidate cytidylyltransferase [Alphaproteobacteria bacterium]|nr:phosphatidate cytidylyltransferase [Alphaproteobacteria bacterium]
MSQSGNGGVRLRIISALVLMPPALAAAWFGWPWLPAVVVAAAAGMGIEWARLVDGGPEQRRALIVGTPLAAAVLVAFAYPAAGCAVAVMGAAAVGAQSVGRTAPAPLWAAGGTLWLALGSVSFLWVAQQAPGQAYDGATVLWFLVLVWSVDVAAYVAGRAFGGPKLAPVLSPNKTWAGFCGGLAGAALAGWGAAALVGAAVAVMVPVSLLLGLAAQFGDLAESMAKRRFKVKDSGGLIPGHGGLLDRLDSLLAAALMLGLLTLVAGAPPLQWRFP